MKRLRTILTVVSGVVCCSLVIILLVSYHFKLWKLDDKSGGPLANDCSVVITSHFRLEFFKGRVLFFNNEVPFLNGIRHFCDSKGILYKNGHAHEVRDWCWYFGDYGLGQVTLIGEQGEFVEKERGFDFPGIIYRFFMQQITRRQNGFL